MPAITRIRLSFIIAGLILTAGLLFAAIKVAPRHFTAIHQNAIADEMAEWEELYGNIATQDDAIQAANMIEYTQRYYPTGEGYRGTRNSEAALEAKREKTITTLERALEEYTGISFGDDHEKWLDYLGNDPKPKESTP